MQPLYNLKLLVVVVVVLIVEIDTNAATVQSEKAGQPTFLLRIKNSAAAQKEKHK